MTFTVEQCEQMISSYIAAEQAILLGQEYEIEISGTRRRLKRADLRLVQSGVRLWETRLEIARMQANRSGRVGYMIPGDR